MSDPGAAVAARSELSTDAALLRWNLQECDRIELRAMLADELAALRCAAPLDARGTVAGAQQMVPAAVG